MTRLVVYLSPIILGLAFCVGGAAASLAQTVESAAASPNLDGADADAALRGNGRAHVTLSYYGDTLGTVSGGVRHGWAYDGRLGLIIDLDLARLIGWAGATAHVSLHQISGRQPTSGYVDSLAALSGIEAEPATRLFNLWIEQTLTDKASVRIGQFTAAQEFFVSPNAALLVNSTFGWPAILAQDLPSGGPACPLATPGVRLSLHPGAPLTIVLAAFDGDPAGPGSGDPQKRDRYGLNSFHLSGAPFLIGEAQFATAAPASGEPRSVARFGAWTYRGDVESPRYDDQGGLLADPNSAGLPKRLRGDWGLYALLDTVLFQHGNTKSNLFVRGSVGPSDRNVVAGYIDLGATCAGLFRRRPSDSLGIAVAYSKISQVARQADADLNRLGGQHAPVRDYEMAIELTYQARITGHWWAQPDIQYIVHPGGGVSPPSSQSSGHRIPNALVIGVRNSARF